MSAVTDARVAPVAVDRKYSVTSRVFWSSPIHW
jgi:hypothetical protein